MVGVLTRSPYSPRYVEYDLSSLPNGTMENVEWNGRWSLVNAASCQTSQSHWCSLLFRRLIKIRTFFRQPVNEKRKGGLLSDWTRANTNMNVPRKKQAPFPSETGPPRLGREGRRRTFSQTITFVRCKNVSLLTFILRLLFWSVSRFNHGGTRYIDMALFETENAFKLYSFTDVGPLLCKRRGWEV